MTNFSSGPEFISIEQAAELVGNGAMMALGGRMQMEPMAFVRELVRQKKKGLRLVTVPGGGLGVDMLVGAGCVESIETPQVVLNEFGHAPNFRRGVERARIKIYDQV